MRTWYRAGSEVEEMPRGGKLLSRPLLAVSVPPEEVVSFGDGVRVSEAGEPPKRPVPQRDGPGSGRSFPVTPISAHLGWHGRREEERGDADPSAQVVEDGREFCLAVRFGLEFLGEFERLGLVCIPSTARTMFDALREGRGQSKASAVRSAIKRRRNRPL